MPATELHPATTEKRPEALELLRELVTLDAQLGPTKQVYETLLERRAEVWEALSDMDPPATWADISRASNVDSVTAIQKVQRRKQQRAKRQANGGG